MRQNRVLKAPLWRRDGHPEGTLYYKGADEIEVAVDVSAIEDGDMIRWNATDSVWELVRASEITGGGHWEPVTADGEIVFADGAIVMTFVED